MSTELKIGIGGSAIALIIWMGVTAVNWINKTSLKRCSECVQSSYNNQWRCYWWEVPNSQECEPTDE